jgi:DNA repair photolyase
MNTHITSGTKEWADSNVNCLKGCHNNCRYCYAKMIAKRFKRCTEETWQNMEIRHDMVNKTFHKREGRVMFPSSHDIIDIPPYHEVCLSVLHKLLKSENQVLVTTKPRLKIIKEIIQRFASYHDLIQFRFTITSNNNRLLEFWEPNAPNFNERFKSLQYAYNQGFKTSVSIEPFLDYDPLKLIHDVTPFVTESVWIGPMNYIPRNNISDENLPYYEQIRRNYSLDHLQEICHKLDHIPQIRFKDSMVIKLGTSTLRAQ